MVSGLVAALAMDLKSGKANTLTSAGPPGPAAVTMLSRPVEKSTKPVATLTPNRLSPYGLNDAKSAGPLCAADATARFGIERLEMRQLCPEAAFAADRRAGINHDLRRVILTGADDQVEYA